MAPSDVMDDDRISLPRADVLEIVRLLRVLLGNERDISELARRTYQSHEDQKVGGAERLKAAARHIYTQRRAREAHLPLSLFGEPGWDMLLALYAAFDDRKHSVSALGSFACSSPTTALRYVSVLTGEGLIERSAHPSDGRVSWVSLSNKGQAAIEGYLQAVLEPYQR